MIKSAAFALLAGGILLTIFGVNAMNLASSDIARFFTGAATDQALWILVGGITMIAAGVTGLFPLFGKD